MNDAFSLAETGASIQSNLNINEKLIAPKRELSPHIDLLTENLTHESITRDLDILKTRILQAVDAQELDRTHLMVPTGRLVDLASFNPGRDVDGKSLDPAFRAIEERLYPAYVKKRQELGLRPETWVPENGVALKREVVKILSPGSYFAHGAFTADLEAMLRIEGLASPTTRQNMGENRQNARWGYHNPTHPDDSAIFFYLWDSLEKRADTYSSSNAKDPRGTVTDMAILVPAEIVVQHCRAINIQGRVYPNQGTAAEIGVTNSLKAVEEGKLVNDPNDNTFIPLKEVFLVVSQDRLEYVRNTFHTHGYEEEWIESHVLAIDVKQQPNKFDVNMQSNDMVEALQREKTRINEWLAQNHKAANGRLLVKSIWAKHSSDKIYTADFLPGNIMPDKAKQIERANPKVFLDPELELESTPYQIRFDVDLLTKLLKEQGFPPSKIGNLTIRIQKRSTGNAYGLYDPQKREIILNTDRMWEKYLPALDIAKNIVDGKLKPDGNEFVNFLKTRRLSNYLAHIPVERSLPFAHKLLLESMNRDLNKTVLHEAKHSIDFATSQRIKLIMGEFIIYFMLNVSQYGMLFGALSLIDKVEPGIYDFVFHNQLAALSTIATITFSSFLSQYFYSPVEKRARGFEIKLGSNPKWLEIIKFSPKDEKNTPLGRLAASGYQWQEKPLYGYEGYKSQQS